jgi:gas vesicle protein
MRVTTPKLRKGGLNMTGTNTLITGLIAGAAIGAAAGLLLAPKPGNVTRRYLAGRADRLRQRIQVGRPD